MNDNCSMSVPPNWVITSVRELLHTIESGKRPKGGVRGISEGVPSVGGEHLKYDGGFDFTNARFIPLEFYEGMNKGKIELDDVLVVKDGATTGKTAFVSEEFPFKEAAVNEHVFILRADKNVLVPKFLFYWMQSEEGQNLVRRHFRGAAQGGITTDFVQEAVFPLPPLAEQRWIVSRITELDSEIENIHSLIDNSISQINLFSKSLATSLGKDVNWGKVRDVVSEKKGSVRSGPFGSQLHHDEFVSSGVAAIGTRDVQVDCLVFNSGWYVTHEKFRQLERYKVVPGDVLCTIIGGSIGRFCVVPVDVPLAFTTKHIQALTLNQDVADPEYVSFMLNHNVRCRESLFGQVGGSAQPSLNSEKILNTEIPIPTISYQHRIVNMIKGTTTTISIQRTNLNAVKNSLLQLKASMLKQAFEGKLVPQDPNDEPASVLLERIKAERAVGTKARGRQKRLTDTTT